jgi:uncharacterized HAD superfamily protein/NTP pyrophosphatase (non-canonical NTP hydrolase)
MEQKEVGSRDIRYRSEKCEDLQSIWADQYEFNRLILPCNPDEMTPQDVQFWHEKYTLLLNKELYEVLDETEFKPHRAIKGKMVRSNMVEELVDVFKYWMCLCQVHGFSAEDIIEEYHRKSNVVKQRFFQEKVMSFEGKIAGIDIDGVLADYPRSFVEFVNEQLGTSYDYHNVRSYNVGESIGLSPEESARLKHLYRESGQKRYIPVIDGAKQFLDELKYMGYIIVLLTSRPYNEYKRMYGDTQYWLAENKLSYDAILWDEHKGERLVKEFGKDKVKFFVDDVAGFANGISDAGMRCFLISRPYNLQVSTKSNVTRVNSLKQVLEAIKHE